MKTQEQIDDLIQVIGTSEDEGSVTNQMEAEVLEFLNEKIKPLDKKHEVMSEDEFSKIKEPDPNTFYYTYEVED